MKKRTMKRTTDNEPKLVRNGIQVRNAINHIVNMLKIAHTPMELINSLKVGDNWKAFSFPGISATGEMWEADSWKDFVTSPDGLDLDWEVYEWLMACPTLEKVNFKQLDRRKRLNIYS